MEVTTEGDTRRVEEEMKVPEEGMSAEKPSGPGFDLAFYFSSPSFLGFFFI